MEYTLIFYTVSTLLGSSNSRVASLVLAVANYEAFTSTHLNCIC